MNTNQQIRTGRHCVFDLNVHLVFVSKYRRKVFSPAHLDRMHEIFKNICTRFDATLMEFNGETEHVHLLISYPPKHSLSAMINELKGISSRLLRKEFGDFHPWLKRRGVLWSPSYFAASCGGAPLETLKIYIQNQAAPKNAHTPP